MVLPKCTLGKVKFTYTKEFLLILTFKSLYVTSNDFFFFAGQAIPMPPELMELYNLYKQELETRNNKDSQFVEELNNDLIRV